jgi:hypothetical protein
MINDVVLQVVVVEKDVKVADGDELHIMSCEARGGVVKCRRHHRRR